MNFIEKMLVGAGIKIASRWAVNSVKWFYKNYEKEIESAEEKLSGLDDWAEDQIGKFIPGFDIPDTYQEKFDKAIHLAFDTVESQLTDGAKWRMVLRAAKAGKLPELTESKIKELEALPEVEIIKALPDEVKAYLSKMKERLGRVKFRAIWEAFVGGEFEIREEEVKAGFRVAANIHKKNKSIFDKLIKESEERQENLRS